MTNKDLVPVLTKEINPLVLNAQKLTITNGKNMEVASEFLANLTKKLKAIAAEKEKVTKPLALALKNERARWSPIEDTLEEAIAVTRRKMTDYQTEASRIADEAAAKVAARVGEGKGKLKPETAVAKIKEIDTPDSHIETSTGSVAFMTVKRFEVLDLSLVPLQYHLPNETLIREAMRNGEQLAGVRYYEEKVPKNR